MSGLENLFATEPRLPSTQGYKMPENVEKWAEVLTTTLREQYPDVGKLPITVEFKKRDDQTGTAVGALHVVDVQSERSMFVPFIIRRWQLSPLDVWMESKSQAVHPMRKDTIKEVFFSPRMADGLDTRPTDSTGQYFNDPSMWTSTYPPLQGRYSYASAGYQLLDQISDQMAPQHLEEFRAVLRQQPLTLLEFEKHGHQELIKKLAAKAGSGKVNTQDLVASAAKLIPTSVISVRREGGDKYSLLSASESLFDLSDTVRMGRDDCLKFLSAITGKADDILHDVDQSGEKMLVVKKAPADSVYLYDLEEVTAEPATEFSCYTVKGRNGVDLTGVVIPSVVSFEGAVLPEKLFVSKTHAAFQRHIAGVKQPTAPQMKDLMKPGDIRVGQTGAFMFADSGKIIATEPVTIKAVVDSGYELIAVRLRDGKKIVICRSGSDVISKRDPKAEHSLVREKGNVVKFDVHAFVETQPDRFMIPTRMVWMPLEDLADVSSTPAEWLEKSAASRLETDPAVVKWTGAVFKFAGAGLPEIEHRERGAAVLLANLGVPVEKVAAVMATAKRKGSTRVHGAARLIAKVAWQQQAAEKFAVLEKNADALRRNLVKAASEVDDKQTVDAMLSLNFLTPQTMAKFLAYRPAFERAADMLAELVMAARLGLKDVQEGALVPAMHQLCDVNEQLKRLEVAFLRPSTKTAAPKSKAGVAVRGATKGSAAARRVASIAG